MDSFDLGKIKKERVDEEMPIFIDDSSTDELFVFLLRENKQLKEENKRLELLCAELKKQLLQTRGGSMAGQSQVLSEVADASSSITSGETGKEDSQENVVKNAQVDGNDRQNVLANEEDDDDGHGRQNVLDNAEGETQTPQTWPRNCLSGCGICGRTLPNATSFIIHLHHIHKLSLDEISLLPKPRAGASSSDPQSPVVITEDQSTDGILVSAIKEELDEEIDVSLNCPQRQGHDLVEGISLDATHPYVCTCKKKYKRRQNFDIHRKAELSPRKYICDRCHRSFGLPHGLKMHKYKAHKMK